MSLGAKTISTELLPRDIKLALSPAINEGAGLQSRLQRALQGRQAPIAPSSHVAINILQVTHGRASQSRSHKAKP